MPSWPLLCLAVITNGMSNLLAAVTRLVKACQKFCIGVGMSCGRSTHTKWTFGIEHMTVCIPQLLRNSCQGHPPTLVSTCNCSPLCRALLDDNVKTACVGSGTLDNPEGSSVCHRSRSVRPIHLLRDFPAKSFDSRFGGLRFCHPSNLRVSSGVKLQRAINSNS